MTPGYRAYLKIKRPDERLVQEYSGLPSANIGDCCGRMNCMFNGIHSMNEKNLCGVAFTVKVPAGDNLAAQVAMDYALPGDIIVIDGAGYTDRALVGGMMAAYAAEKRLGGFVVNGAVRDIEDLRNGEIPVFAIDKTPLGPYKAGPGEINVPVCCGGQVVMPGDIIVGDQDGVVVIPQRSAEELLEMVRENIKIEQSEIEKMNQGTYLPEDHQKVYSDLFKLRGGLFTDSVFRE